MGTTKTQSEREGVLDYIWGRMESAFKRGDDDEVSDLRRLHKMLSGITDEEYVQCYSS